MRCFAQYFCMYFKEVLDFIDNKCSLKEKNKTDERDFNEYKLAHSQRLLDNFFEMAIRGITIALLYRLVVLQKAKNVNLDLFLPIGIFLVILIAYYINKQTSWMKHYFHILFIPIVGMLTAKKTIAQNTDHFYLNESFASWLLMMLLGGFSSSMQWYTVVTINFFCFMVYISLILHQYGLQDIGKDFYVHIPTTIIFSACLVRMNEVNLRNSFSLLNQSKIQEKKWQRVLRMLTDGVLIMEHTRGDDGILLKNPSLERLFGGTHGPHNHFRMNLATNHTNLSCSPQSRPDIKEDSN